MLWGVTFRAPVANVFDLSVANAPAAGVFPCLLLNPSQDYRHLKDRRAAIQAAGYNGLRAPSTRDVGGGSMTVLFDDQSRNVGAITPYEVEFRLITPARHPTAASISHATDRLDYLAGEVRVTARLPRRHFLPRSSRSRHGPSCRSTIDPAGAPARRGRLNTRDPRAESVRAKLARSHGPAGPIGPCMKEGSTLSATSITQWRRRGNHAVSGHSRSGSHQASDFFQRITW